MKHSRLCAAAVSALAGAFLLAIALVGQANAAPQDDPPSDKPPAKQPDAPPPKDMDAPPPKDFDAPPPKQSGKLGGPRRQGPGMGKPGGPRRPGEFGPPRGDAEPFDADEGPGAKKMPPTPFPGGKPMPGAMPGPMPGGMPGPMPGGMPGAMPGGMPGVMPGGMYPPGGPRWPFQLWESMEKTDPDMFALFRQEADLDRRTRELAMRCRQVPAAERDAVRKELVQAVTEHFDVRQKRRQLEIKRLEEELQRLRDAIDRRNKVRQELVNKRVTELLGQEDEGGF